MAVCKACGEHFNKTDAILKFNHYFSGSSGWTYDVLNEDYCFDCAVDVAYEMYYEEELIDPYLDDDDEDTDFDNESAEYKDVGCTACGNPAYPNCKTSCPMFDD